MICHRVPWKLFAGGVLLLARMNSQVNGAEVFTLQLGSPPPAAAPLALATNEWAWRPGTNAPQVNWLTAAPEELDDSWTYGRGGFGYGDAGIADENTAVNLAGWASTLYIRQVFEVLSEPAAEARLELVVDYDDGFVAYLDGQEIARANLTNGPGTAVLHTATTGGNSHEASCCNAPTHPPEVFDCGPVGGRLGPGRHVLALIGVNQSISSSDFHLIASMRLGAPVSTAAHGALLSVVTTNVVELFGSNTMAGAARVMVNGDEAEFDAARGQWSRAHPLAPGCNRLTIQAVDSAGRILASTNRMVVADLGSVAAGGPLAAHTVWYATNGVVRLSGGVAVPPGGTLTVEEGVVVLASPNSFIRATNAVITAHGTAERPIYFLPADGASTNWGGIVIAGTNGHLHLRHMDLMAGRLEALNGASALVEDSALHDYWTTSPPLIHTLGVPNPVHFTLRRTHIARYHELLFQVSTNHLEGCLMEFQGYSGDGTDFDGARPGSYIRHCTYRRGQVFNTDALDMGEYAGGDPSRGVTIEGCLLHHFVDKGISMGVQVDVTVTNCVIHHVDAGIAVKDLSTAGIYQTTIADANHGFECYNKMNPASPTGGGFITNAFNNILWNMAAATIALRNGSTLEAHHCDFEGTNWPGEANLSVNPLFVDAPREDYRLAPDSPVRGAGVGGARMGAAWPVGGIPGTPLNLAALTDSAGMIRLNWMDDADNEEGFEIQRATGGAVWQTIGSASANTTEYADTAVTSGTRYYYRVRATNGVGTSAYSGMAGALLPEAVIEAGGILATDATWSGRVAVVSNVVVPQGITLTVSAGAEVRLTNGAWITAQEGGLIRVEGQYTNRVVFRGMADTVAWGGLRAEGPGATLMLRHADLDHGGVELGPGAAGLVEDCLVHDVPTAIAANAAASAVVRRCRVSGFSRTTYHATPVLVEDCLLESMTAPDGNAVEIQGALPEWQCVVRRCAVRHATGANSDAYVVSGSAGVTIEDCVAQDITDKGVSLGAQDAGGLPAQGITVSNCLVYGAGTGVAVKDGSTAGLIQCTIANSAVGLRLYQKYALPADGGHITNGWNNIIWGNGTGLSLENNSTLRLEYSDLQDVIWPGVGNTSVEPRFRNVATGDFELASDSACLTNGVGGGRMGVLFPTGPHIDAPSSVVATGSSNAARIEWVCSGRGVAAYEIERSLEGGPFARLQTVDRDARAFVDAGVGPGRRQYRVRGVSLTAQSDYALSPTVTIGTAPVILSYAIGPSNVFVLSFDVSLPRRYVIEGSTNLVEWAPVWSSDNAPPAEPIAQVALAAATNQACWFYRLRSETLP